MRNQNLIKLQLFHHLRWGEAAVRNLAGGRSYFLFPCRTPTGPGDTATCSTRFRLERFKVVPQISSLPMRRSKLIAPSHIFNFTVGERCGVRIKTLPGWEVQHKTPLLLKTDKLTNTSCCCSLISKLAVRRVFIPDRHAPVSGSLFSTACLLDESLVNGVLLIADDCSPTEHSQLLARPVNILIRL